MRWMQHLTDPIGEWSGPTTIEPHIDSLLPTKQSQAKQIQHVLVINLKPLVKKKQIHPKHEWSSFPSTTGHSMMIGLNPKQ